MLSVIVPVYNTENQVERCLKSLVKLKDTEIIVINDGSTDRSEEIINKYIDKITYYTKPNSGLADTRNFGLDKAKGDYILFVDSDDYVEQDLIEKLKIYMDKKIDVIKFKTKRVDENGNVLEKIEGSIFDTLTGEEAFEKLYCTDSLLDSACTYLFKREYLIQNDFKFPVRYIS